MPFMVIYRTSDGSSRYEQADAIDEAALFVERLRNSENIDQIRIYRMEEISFAFRPYYKVELGLPERQSASTKDSMRPDTIDAPPEPVDEPATDPSPDTEVALDAPAPVDEPTDDVPPPVSAPTLPPPPPSSDGETAGANGRRGLFGR